MAWQPNHMPELGVRHMVLLGDMMLCEVIQMGTQAALQPSTYEQALISIVRALPVERVVQILDS